jgi:thiamine biosynthesis lipoprotein
MDATNRADWNVWSCAASVVVTPSINLTDALQITREAIAAVDAACSRFRNDSELALRSKELADGAEVSPLLAELIEASLVAAEWTDGDVDPTLGNELADLGYDRDIATLYSGPELDAAPSAPQKTVRRPQWKRIAVDGTFVTIPPGIILDLGASAKAFTADYAVASIVERLGGGALVSLGGDIATAGVAPDGGWQVLVQDTPDDPAQQVTLSAGGAIATSSTQKRRWLSAGFARHHILDPKFGLPATVVWRSATVSAASCLRANALSTAAIVRGRAAAGWLNGLGAPARLVDTERRVVTTGGWPVADGLPTMAVAR